MRFSSDVSRIVVVLFVSLWGHAAFAIAYSDLGLCESGDGLLKPIRDLVCHSQPALLEASNPGLKIPTCGDESSQPRVLSETLPVAAVFVSCIPETLKACRAIASEILKRKTGATVNILINQDFLKEPEALATLKEVRDIADTAESPLNVIPIKLPLEKYTRDPALMLGGARDSIPTYVANPYSTTGRGDLAKGQKGTYEALTKEIAQSCGYHYESSFEKLKAFDTAYQMIGQTNAMCPLENSKSMQMGCEKSPGTNGANRGGNFLAMPNGTLLVSETETQKVDPGIVDYFKKNQRVVSLQIPNLKIGHIDEVFRFIPSSDKCGFSLLRASPAEMKKFLATRPKSEAVVLSFGAPTTVRVGDLLKSGEAMARWDAEEKTIEASTAEILKELKGSYPACEPKVVSVPMFWDKNGRPEISNPVNAMTVNGHYFFSKPSRALLDSNSQEIRREYPAYREYVEKLIQPLFSKPVVAVETESYDKGSGNFHCATTNIFLPCK